MKKISFFSLLALISLSLFSYGQTKRKIFLDDKIGLPDSFLRTAKISLAKCDAKWHLTYDTIVIDSMQKYSDYISFKSKEKTFAITEKNTIYIRVEYLKYYNNFYFRNLINHEVFHTLDGPMIFLSPPQMYFIDKDTFVAKAVKGLSVRVNQGAYQSFVESSATYAAYDIDNEQIETDYEKITYLLNRMVMAKWITVDDLVKATKESNVFYFCSKVLNKENITFKEVVYVMGYFDLAQEGNPKDTFDLLSKQRW